MKARTIRGWTIAACVVTLLVTAGTGGRYGGDALADEDGFAENFKCYVINHGDAPKKEVRLCDQFHECEFDHYKIEGGEKVTVREPHFLCTPAKKCRKDKYGKERCDGSDEGPHLKCYFITPAGPPVNEYVTVKDQFFPYGDLVKVQTAHLLCEKAEKKERDH